MIMNTDAMSFDFRLDYYLESYNLKHGEISGNESK